MLSVVSLRKAHPLTKNEKNHPTYILYYYYYDTEESYYIHLSSFLSQPRTTLLRPTGTTTIECNFFHSDADTEIMRKQSIALKYRSLFTGRRFLPRLFRRKHYKDCWIFSFCTKKSMAEQTPEQQIYCSASVNSAFVRDLEDALSETTLSFELDCFAEISLCFDQKSTATFSFEESESNDAMQSVGCTGRQFLVCE
jgi:hypothetical protein